MSKYTVEEANTDYVTVSDQRGNSTTMESGVVTNVSIEEGISPSKLKELITETKTQYLKYSTTL